MAEWLLVVCADLARRGTAVVPGPETARVARQAAAASIVRPDARICIPAGYSRRFSVSAGEVVRAYLAKECGVEGARIVAPTYKNHPFTTNGEMLTFAEYLFKANDTRPRITLVARWWHAPRARRLLRARLADNAIRPIRVEVLPVRSLDVFGMARETLAWAKNARNF